MLKFDQSLQISDISGVPWIENIPEHWDLKKLKYVASIRFSNVDKNTSESEHPVLLCNYVDVYKNSKITSNIDFMQASARLEEIRKFHVQVGDVLVTKDSERPDDIAIAAFVAENITNLLCGYHLALIRPDSNILNGCFLNYLFSSKLFRFQYERMANGVTRFGLSQNAFKDSIIPLPSLEEQNKIVSFLDQQTAKLDQLIEKKKRLIDLLQEKRQALITQAVTKGLDPNVPMKDSGIEWLGEVPAHWNIEKLKFFVNIYGGGTPAKDNLEYWNGDIPWVSPKDMKTELIYSTEEYITEKGLANSTTTLIDRKSVLVVVRSGILKRSLPVAINVVPVSLNQDIKAIIPKRHVTVDYLGWVFKGLSHFILYLCKKEGATVDSIEVDDLLKMPIPFPIKDEQDRICQYLQYETGKLDCLISKLESQIYKIQEYRQALITAAVTGQIDVLREKLAVSADPIPAGKE